MPIIRHKGSCFAAIDIGTNAVRLKIGRFLDDGTLSILHSEREGIRPGEGVFETGTMSENAVERLVRTLEIFNEICEQYGAIPRAVATSAMRDASNRAEVVKRARKEAGVDIEIISGREEARLISLGALWGTKGRVKNLLVDIGGGSTEVALCAGDHPTELWSLSIGAVRLTELFATRGKVDSSHLALMRKYALRACEDALPVSSTRLPSVALGTSGSIRALVPFAAPRGEGEASYRQVHEAVRKLCALSFAERMKRFESRRAEVIISAAVILETVMKHLKIDRIRAGETGLRDGVLVDLYRRHDMGENSDLVEQGALDFGRRLGFDERHAAQVAEFASGLFDDLHSLHHLAPEWRVVLRVAALLHDIGYAVNRQKHHRHSAYLLENTDLPGLSDRGRIVAARLTRFHRRRAPKKGHPGLDGLSPEESEVVTLLAPLLRLADAFDRGHHRSVQELSVKIAPRSLTLQVEAKRGAALELWDAERESPIFEQVYGRKLRLRLQA